LTLNYNPEIHHRRSIRLKGYDYSQSGMYFITICCDNRKHRFGTIENDQMILNNFGEIAYNEWTKLPIRFPNFMLDVFQIMPNHLHGIIALTTVGAGFTPAQNDNENGQPQLVTPAPIDNEIGQPQLVTPAPIDNENGQPQGLPLHDGTDNIGATARVAPTIGDIIGAYKSIVANECLKIFKSKWTGINPVPTMGKLWQRNYHEHIIRNEQSYQKISDYIINNPKNWKDDKFYCKD